MKPSELYKALNALLSERVPLHIWGACGVGNRHTLITELAESCAGDETIMEIAGHVDRQMLRHYSHIRMKAKRAAVEAVVAGRAIPSQSGDTQSQ